MTMAAAPRTFADLIDAAVPQLRERLLAERVRRTWPRLVGHDIARRARPTALSGGVLQIAVDNSPWLQELTLREAELAKRVRAEFPGVASLRFVLGALPPDTAAPARAIEERRPALTEPDLREIEAAAAVIADPVLAAAARRVMTRAWAAARSRGAVR